MMTREETIKFKEISFTKAEAALKGEENGKETSEKDSL